MLKSFLSLVLFGLVFSFNLSTLAQVPAQITNRSFPFPDFGKATITSVLFAAHTPPTINRIVTENPSRKNLITLENKAHVRSAYWPGQPGQPMVFLIPGIGGVSDKGSVGDLAKIFQSWGYHVVTFNNPMSWQFALTLSPDGAPGYFPEDAEILYENMLSVKKQLEQKFHVRYSQTLLASYSLGCQHAYEILKLDDQKKDFDFSQVLMISPPLDLAYTLHKYDSVNQQGDRINASKSLTVYEKLRGRLISLYEHVISLAPEKVVGYVAQNYPLNNQEGEIIIGGNFKESLEEVLYVTSLVHPQRSQLFKSPLAPTKRNARYAEIKAMSFQDYFQKFILQKMYVRNQFIDSQDLLNSFS